MTMPPSSRDPFLPSDSAPDADWEAVARYLAGESSPAERQAVGRWLREHPAEQAFVEALGHAVAPAAGAAGDIDVEGALRVVRARREPSSMRPVAVAREASGHVGRSRPNERIRMVPPSSAAPGSWRTRWPIAALAAAGVVFVAAAAVLSLGRVHRDVGTVAAARTFTTAVGQRDSVVLADGSRVILGPGSELRVAAGYGAARRDVELTGEGYFNVRHDAARPFSVRAGGATIRDVGTTFAVHDDDAAGVRVAVTSGAVQVRVAGHEADLAAGDVATLSPDGALSSTRGGVRDDDLAWTRGSLVFRDASMSEVRADLRRWYGVELRVTDSTLARRHLTATFTTEPTDRVLDVIALTLGGQLTRRGDTALVSERVR